MRDFERERVQGAVTKARAFLAASEAHHPASPTDTAKMVGRLEGELRSLLFYVEIYALHQYATTDEEATA
jgi:hypothetical protein